MADTQQLHSRKKISVVFSFRNEEEVLPELLDRTRHVMRQEVAQGHIGSYEMVFVNDDSTDQSLAILKESSRQNRDVLILTMSRRFGVSPCALAGMEYSSGDAVVYLDADLQDPPEVIPELIAAWQKNPDVDVVHTVRISREGESRAKIFITHMGYWILKKVMDFNLPFEAGDFKLLSRRVVNHLIQFKERNPFLRGLVCWVGFGQMTVQYQRGPRQKGKTKFPVFSRGVILNFLDSALITFSSIPLKMALFIGPIFCLASLGGVVYYSLKGWCGLGLSCVGVTAILVLLFLSGVQLIAIGLLGLYLNSVFQESKRRPNYIIKETFGFAKEPDIL